MSFRYTLGFVVSCYILGSFHGISCCNPCPRLQHSQTQFQYYLCGLSFILFMLFSGVFLYSFRFLVGRAMSCSPDVVFQNECLNFYLDIMQIFVLHLYLKVSFGALLCQWCWWWGRRTFQKKCSARESGGTGWYFLT